MTCDPEGRQDYADDQTVSIEPRKQYAAARPALIRGVIWRRSGRRYRLPDLHSNNDYTKTLGTQLAAEMTLWNRCVRDLQAELPEQEFNTWIRPLQAVEDGPVLRLLAPNRFVVNTLQKQYLERILEIVVDHGIDAEVVVEVGSRHISPPISSGPKPRPVGINKPAPKTVESRLNRTFTFDADGRVSKLADTYKVTARRFDKTTATGGQGGYDIAKFWDTLDDDRFVADEDSTAMYNPDNEMLYDAIAFDKVKLNHVNGGNNKVEKAAAINFLLGEYEAP